MKESTLRFKRLFIANRGEIALRIARTARRLGLEVSSAFSSVDSGLPHLRLCHRAVELTGDPAAVYLDIGKQIDAAKRMDAEAVHPGYGFLAENEEFSAAVKKAGLIFVGPSPESIKALGDKLRARKAAAQSGLAAVPGEEKPVADLQSARKIAARIHYPLLIKAAGGGGGRGMRIVENAGQLQEALARASSEAKAAFGDGRVFIEKYIARARHVEIQILGDGHGRAISLGERECSVQRRHQKLIEESPAPAVPPAVAEKMGALAARLAADVHYAGAGTVEFIVPFGAHDFYFIEVNTRLQVEHPVTELRTGIDLAEEQLAIAGGKGFSRKIKAFAKHCQAPRDETPMGAKEQQPAVSAVAPCSAPPQGASRTSGLLLGTPASQPVAPFFGHAIEARVIAEDPDNHFQAVCGKLECVMFPSGPGIRVDSWAEAGLTVTPYYDSLLAKVLAWGRDREEAIARLRLALRETIIHPLRTTAPFLAEVLGSKPFRSGQYDTGLVAKLKPGEPERLPLEAGALAAADYLSANGHVSALPPQPQNRALSAWQRTEAE